LVAASTEALASTPVSMAVCMVVSKWDVMIRIVSGLVVGLH
jgi:hypothetical protein